MTWFTNKSVKAGNGRWHWYTGKKHLEEKSNADTNTCLDSNLEKPPVKIPVRSDQGNSFTHLKSIHGGDLGELEGRGQPKEVSGCHSPFLEQIPSGLVSGGSFSCCAEGQAWRPEGAPKRDGIKSRGPNKSLYEKDKGTHHRPGYQKELYREKRPEEQHI